MMAIFVSLLLGQAKPPLEPPPMLRRPVEVPEQIQFEAWRKGGVPGQLEAPCPASRVIYTVEGKCWGLTTDKPPCPPETWQHGGACYVPAVLKPSPAA